MNSTNKLKIGLIGLGNMGVRNAHILHRHTDFTVTSIFDTNAVTTENLGKKLAVKPYYSIDEFLDDKNDLIFISVPHHLLSETAIKCLMHKKSVLIEKPMCLTLEQAEKISRTANNLNLHVTTAYSMRYMDTIKLAKKIVDEGVIEDIQRVDINWTTLKTFAYFGGSHSPTPDDWRTVKSKSGGGYLMMTTCHAIDFVRYITSLDFEFISSLYANNSGIGDVEDTLIAVAKLGNSALVSVVTSSCELGGGDTFVKIVGKTGTILIYPNEVHYFSKLYWGNRRPGKWHKFKFKPSTDHIDAWLSDVAEKLSKGLEPTPNIRDATKSLEATLGFYKNTNHE